MKKGFNLLIGLMLFVMASMTAQAQQPTKTSNTNDEWEIRWSASDEFNNATPDWSKWIKTGNLPNTTAWKWNNDDNVKINNGVAELTMRQNPNNASDGGTYFKSGILKSYQTFTYGYYEAKIKGASIGEGVCPSFWLFSNFDYSVGNGKTVYSEIDIVELQQFDWYEGHQDDIRDLDLNLHAVVMENGQGVWRRPKQHPEEQLNKWRAPWDPRNDFHIYGCEVNEQEIIWYVDGVEVGRKPNTYWYRPMNVTLSLGLRKPFVEFYNNRNNAVNPVTDPKANAALPGMPTTMYVDYVRVWEKTGTNNNPPVEVGQLGNPSFEDGLNYWTAGAGNHEVVNNNAQSGNSSAHVSNASVAQVVTLEANTTYTVSGYGKVASGTSDAYMGVSNAVSNTLVENYQFTSTNYQKGTITFTTGNSQSGYRVWFWSSGSAYCDNFSIAEDNGGGGPTDIAVTGVNLNVSSLSLGINDTNTLNATVLPSNATNKSVTWSTSNANVATVSGGLVTAVSQGNATITVRTNDGNYTATCAVNVTSGGNNGGGASGLPQVGQVIWLKSSEGNYVTVNTGSSTSLQATKSSLTTKEQFIVVDGGDGYLGLQCVATNKYVTATSITNTPLRCGATGLFERQKFSFADEGNNTISIKAKINNLYCRTDLNNSNRAVEARSSSVQSWETFTWGEVDNIRLGIQEINNPSLNITYYPNPIMEGQEFFTIQLGEPLDYQLSLMDINGKMLYKTSGTGITTKVWINNMGLKQGLYFLQIETKKQVALEKIMVR